MRLTGIILNNTYFINDKCIVSGNCNRICALAISTANTSTKTLANTLFFALTAKTEILFPLSF